MQILQTKNLIKEYSHKRVVNNLSIQICSGEIVGLLGPNGAGKTTTFYMIAGLIKPDGGKIFFSDEDGVHGTEVQIRALASCTHKY